MTDQIKHQISDLSPKLLKTPSTTQTKTHDDVLCLETRELHVLSISEYYGKLGVYSVLLVFTIVAIVAAVSTHNALVTGLSATMFATASAFFLTGRAPKGLKRAKARLVRATITKKENEIVLCLPEGEFVISRSRSPYYKPLAYLCREAEYEADFCVYTHPKTDLPFLAFRDEDEFFLLEPPPKSAPQANEEGLHG